MNATSNRLGEEAETPLFYSPRLASPEETLALLTQQRAREAQVPGLGVSEVSFSCSNRCSVCLHRVACHEDTES